MVCPRRATNTMNRPLKTVVWRLRNRRSGKASLFWKYAKLNVGFFFFLKKIDVSVGSPAEMSVRNGKHTIANWRKGLVIKWQRTWSRCVHVFMGCRKVEFVREEAGWGNPRERAEWVAWSVVLFVSVTVFWVFVVKFQKKEMASVRTVHQRRNQLKVWKNEKAWGREKAPGVCMIRELGNTLVNPHMWSKAPPKTT